MLKRKLIDGKEYIFDIIRKKYVMLSPEEWVRQQIINYLVTELNYPSSLISVEKQIRVGSQSKRYDILVYKNDVPWLIVECKREKVPILKSTLLQLESYVANLPVEHIVLTNGIEIHSFSIETRQWFAQFPSY